MKRLLLLLLLGAGALSAQVSFPNPVRSGASLPATCSPGGLAPAWFLLTAGGPIATPYYCSAPNTWTAANGGGGGSGTVTSIATSCGVTGGTITTTGTVSSQELINSQAAGYAILTGDCGNAVVSTDGSAAAYTIAQAGSAGFPAGWYVDLRAGGAGTVTLTPATSTINGSATLVLTTGQSARIISDGTNYTALLGGGSSGCSGDINAGCSQVTNGSHITNSSIPNSGLVNTGVTVNGTICTLGASCNPAASPMAAPVAFASIPSCTTTAFYQFLNNSFYQPVYCDGSSTLHYYTDGLEAFLPGAASGWTVVNGSSGTATLADNVGAVTLSTTSAVIGFEGALKAVPAVPYTKTFVISPIFSETDSANPVNCGVAWSAGTSTSSAFQLLNISSHGVNGGINATVQHFTSFALAGGANDYLGSELIYTGRFFYLRLADDNTNRTFSISSDGIKWITLYSTARATPFTPADYMFGCYKSTANGGKPWAITLISLQ